MNDFELRERANQVLTTHDIDAALPLLLAMQAPRQDLDFFLLNWTAQAFFDRGRHDEAYSLFKKLFGAFPRKAAANAAAVKSVRAIEQQRGAGLTLVPVARRSYRSWVIGLVTGVPMTVALLYVFNTVKNHQPLHLFNPVAVAAEVTVDAQPRRLLPGAHEVMQVAEGRHVIAVKLDNGVAYQKEVDVENTMFSRFFNRNAFVFDVLGAGAFEEQTVHAGRTEVTAVHAGHDFLTFHHLHYVFTDPAADRSRDSDEDDHATVHWVLALPKDPPAVLLGRVSVADGRAYAEGLIRGGVRDPSLIAAYRNLGLNNGFGPDAAELIRQTMR